MSGHTPGPWKVSSPQNDPNAFDIESVSGTKITRGYWGTAACADARLISAAPELLSALKEILEAERKREVMPMGWVARAKAAVAKVEGGR